MKKLILVMLVALVTLTADASSVLWNVVSIGESEHQEFRVLNNDERPFFWSVFDFDVSVSGNRATLTSNPGGDRILSYAGAWLTAYCGDIVNSATTLHSSSYFEYGLLGNGEGQAETPISVEVGEVNYLKIVLQDGEQCFDYQDGMRTAMPDCYYGWLAYSVDSKGKVSVLSSALDITGSSIVVGGVIPEPSCTLLMLMGCVGLLLKRPARRQG